MPKTINRKKAARRVRKNIPAGSNAKGQGRQRSGGSETQAPAVIANSIFALTLKPKRGIDVYLSRKDSSHDDDYSVMYRDLLATITHAQKLLKIKGTNMDPLASGLPLSTAMYMIIKRFKDNILPEGYSFQIDKSDDGYFFTALKELEYPWCWHTFEVKTVAMKLRKTNKRLHDLFITIMGQLFHKAGITAWWNGGYGYVDYQLEDVDELIANHYEFDNEEDEKNIRATMQALVDCYKKGEAKEYERLISRVKIIKPQELRKKVNRFNKSNPVVKWMLQCCDFLDREGEISDYEFETDDEREGIPFYMQSAIIWDYEDYAYHMQGESLDAETQGCGVLLPILSIPITKSNRFIDNQNLAEREKWPKYLSDLHTEFNVMLKKVMK